MATAKLIEKKVLKQALKEVLAEMLQKRRELFHDALAEVLEDFALSEAIRQGQDSGVATRDEVFRVLRRRK